MQVPLEQLAQFTGQAAQVPLANFYVPVGQKSQFGLQERSGLHLPFVKVNPVSHAEQIPPEHVAQGGLHFY